MQAKLVRLLSQMLYLFNVFTVQLIYAAAHAPRLNADTRVVQATAEVLKCQEVQIKLLFADIPSDTLFTIVGEFWLFVLCETKYSLGRRRLSKSRDLVTVSLFNEISFVNDLVLERSDEPIDFKSPKTETLMLVARIWCTSALCNFPPTV